jgi:16S rRNA G1207 methylase RsmC
MVPDHYFTAAPAVPSNPRTITIDVAGRPVELETDAGVFSRDRLDPGTAALLAEAPLPAGGGHVLDLGCGYGPVAISLGLRNPELTITAVDVNQRALEITRRNAARHGIRHITVEHADAAPGNTRFDAIYCNPPIRVGKDVLHGLLSSWLRRMTDSGHAYLVVSKHLGSDSLAAWLQAESFKVTRLASKRGYRVLDVVHDSNRRAPGAAE